MRWTEGQEGDVFVKKHSKLLLASWIIGALYFVYILIYFTNGVMNGENSFEIIGHGIAFMMVAPHIFCVFLALIFNIIGWATSKRWTALTGGILYCVAALSFIMYCFFVVPSIILSFVGFARLNIHQEQPSTPVDPSKVSLFDRLFPADSIREKILPPVCWVLSFVLTLLILNLIFVR